MTDSTRQLPWSLADIDFSAIDPARVRGDDAMFLLVCSASFVESGSDTYTGNLLERFAHDDEVGDWLRDHWEPEELQHGRALQAYVRHVWPEFDWDGAYADFFADYSRLCTMEELEPTCGQELAARCIVEMGTTTYYQALNAACKEPVLRDLTWRIRSDEVRHYKHFYGFFQKYASSENLGRRHILGALVRRALELRREDTTIASRHVAAWHRRSRPSRVSDAAVASNKQLIEQAYRLVSEHLPMELAVRMAIKPLRLSPALQRFVMWPLSVLGAGIVHP
ncbi:ferritin-like domain-containing protein [Scleromatobacter humisilvae]|uniref:Ferritin-like domain-containing protein n=1 Tax=Scleromatobacter humisilvae TaxID=2897159 RepID=A0A9X1YFN8_9BURK|nr:ferritin-like domain-containing protein [Scleromatobacter humisilvae]MCK9684807.1 ferritin-like domain-containing protein [Scleromatobacter humisilvae]